MAVKKIDKAFRRWAIEQAMKWPVITNLGGGGLGGYTPHSTNDADVIGRAKKIEDYVTGKTK